MIFTARAIIDFTLYYKAGNLGLVGSKSSNTKIDNIMQRALVAIGNMNDAENEIKYEVDHIDVFDNSYTLKKGFNVDVRFISTVTLNLDLPLDLTPETVVAILTNQIMLSFDSFANTYNPNITVRSSNIDITEFRAV